MFSSPLIIDITIILFIFIFSLLGIKNGFIAEFQNFSKLFIAILLAKFISSYFASNNFYNLDLIFFVFLTISIFIVGFIIDSVIYNINIVKLDENADKLIGFLLGTAKSFLIIILIILGCSIIPIQEDIQTNLYKKFSESSVYSFCESLKQFIIK